MTTLVEPQTQPQQRHEPKPMSLEEFLALPDSVGYELLEGVPTERKPMGALSDYVAAKVIVRLGGFAEQRDAGHVFGAETTYRCFGEGNTGRRADVSFVRKGRFPGEQIPRGAIEIPADLVVEVLSPYDLAYEVEEKVAQYLQFGFGEVWVVYPNTRTIHLFRKGEPPAFLDAAGTLAGRGPLEGFSCPVAGLFPPAAEPALQPTAPQPQP